MASGYGGYKGPTGGSAVSVSTWNKLDLINTAGIGYLFSFGSTDAPGQNNNEFTCVYDSTSSGLVLLLGGDNYATYPGAPWNNGSWHNLVATCPGSGTPSDLRLYLDGALLSPTTTSGLSQKNTAVNNFFRVGKNVLGFGKYDGLVDEVAVWDVQLTASAVAVIYNGGFATLDLNANQGFYTSASALQLWWRFEGTSSDQVINSGGGGVSRNGFITGGAVLPDDFSLDVP